MPAETGSLTTILDHLLNIFRLGQRDVAVQAWSLLTTLATIELLLASFGWALTGHDALVGLIRRILTIGFFVFVVQNYDSLLHVVVEGFIQTGKTASSAGGDALASVRDPSAIVDAGYFVALPILEHLKSYSGIDTIYHLHDVVITALCAVGIVIAYFVIAIQVFITYLEFAIVSTLGLILIPFGTLRHTSFLAEKVFGAIISFGVKLMVLGLLVSVAVPVLREFVVPPDPSWKQLFNLCLVSFAVAALAWHAPGVAAALLAGGPSLTAGTAAGTAVAAGAGGALAPYATKSAALGGAAAVRSAIVTPSKIAAAGAGAASAGAAVALSKGAAKGAGAGGKLLQGGIAGGLALGRAGINAVLAPAKEAGAEVSKSFHDSKLRVPGYVELKATQAAADVPQSQSAAGGGTTPDKNPSPQASDSASSPKATGHSRLATSIHLAKQSVPNTAHPGPGISVPLKNQGDRDE